MTVMRMSSALLPVAARGCNGVVARLPAGTAFEVATVGHLVPRRRTTGRVHSVFSRACNVACGDALLTLLSPHGDDGPATLRLGLVAPADFSRWFSAGESIEIDVLSWRTARLRLDLRRAACWRPAATPRRAAAALVHRNLERAQRRIAAADAGVVAGAAAATVARLGDACRALDAEGAARHALALVGLGEGLTPAGDDFLAGLVAGLELSIDADAPRRRVVDALRRVCLAAPTRTSDIGAHMLALAARGHHACSVLALRDALAAADDVERLDAALARLLAVGATSGAATARGVVCGVGAWLEAGSA